MCNAINECDVLFSLRTIFPIGFSDRGFNGIYAYRGNHPKGSIVKHIDLILEGKKEEDPNPSPFVCGLSPKLLDLGRAIYMWELYVIITNIQIKWSVLVFINGSLVLTSHLLTIYTSSLVNQVVIPGDAA
jgi:hypothetical protein